MKPAAWKRLMLAGLVALSVAGASAATFSAGTASADIARDTCHGSNEDCGVPRLPD